jgi:hypothetical protein
MGYTARRQRAYVSLAVIVVVALVAALALVAAPRPAFAAGVVGNGTAASCTEAALDAALAGGGLVTFDCGPNPVTITITTAASIGSTPTTVDGGDMVTLSGNDTAGLFDVGDGDTLNLLNLTLTDGEGSAIDVQNGTLNLTDVVVQNGERGIYNDAGVVNLTDSVITNNVLSGAFQSGGGIESYNGSLTLTRSVISNNQVTSNDTGFGRGGGIYFQAQDNSDNLTIVDSTITGNTANKEGGGIYALDDVPAAPNPAATITGSTIDHNAGNNGGGLFSNNVALSVTNATFSANQSTVTSGSAIFHHAGTGTLNNVTITDNDATGISAVRIRAGATLNAANTIIAGNVGGVSNLPSDCQGTLTSMGYNVIGDTDNCVISGTTTGNLLDTDPLLDTLQDNGGPTETHAIDTDSPAYNAGNPDDPPAAGTLACATVDQRGAVRPQAGRCDIGAFEVGTLDAVPPVTNAASNPVPNAAGWTRFNTTVTLTATDNFGVDHITYSATGAQPIGSTDVAGDSAQVVINTNGETVLSYFAVDTGGNTETTKQVTVKLDKNVPVMDQAPAAKFVELLRLGTDTVPVMLYKWTAHDVGPSGLNRYWLQQSLDGGALTTLTLPSPLAPSQPRQLAPDHDYMHQIRAVDNAGGTSSGLQTPTYHLSVLDDDEAAVVYAGTWTNNLLSYAWGGTAYRSGSAGATATVTFTGTSLGWVTTLANDRGIATISVDGGPAIQVDLYRAQFMGRRFAWVVNGLTPGSHTVVITVTGTKNPASSGFRVEVDGFAVLS